MSLPRVNVLGVGVHAVDMRGAVAVLREALGARRKGYVCLTNVSTVMDAQRDHALRRVLNGALLSAPDGMPMVWMGWARGERGMDRVFGPDLMIAVCEGIPGATHYFYGGAPGVAEELRDALQARIPGLRVVGTFTPPFRPLAPAEKAAFVADVARTRPDIVWVGIGSPKQETFCAAHLAELDTTLTIGIGAAFDLHTGRMRDAPTWLKRAGLQWAHRLVQEPRRLAGRYLGKNPRFVVAAARQLAGLTRYPLDD